MRNWNIMKVLTSLDKIDVNSRDRYGRTPLHFAAGSRMIKNVKYLTSLKDVELNPIDKITLLFLFKIFFSNHLVHQVFLFFHCL